MSQITKRMSKRIEKILKPRSFVFPLYLILLQTVISTCFQVDTAHAVELDFNYESYFSFDSSRKDYGTLTYQDLATSATEIRKLYDKNHLVSVNDMYFALKKDLGHTHFLDFKEFLHYRSYRPQDIYSISGSSYKYNFLDHLLNVKYGAAVTQFDVIELDYFHNLMQAPEADEWDYRSHRAKARYNHRINPDTALSMEGWYEEREYPNFNEDNYKEIVAAFDFSVLLPRKYGYRAVSSSSRGEKTVFEKTPNGLAARKAVDYYTDWTRHPDKDEDEAKYTRRQTRGDWYINFRGEVRSKNLTLLDNYYSQPSATLSSTYHFAENALVFLENRYYRRDHENESKLYSLYNHFSNRVFCSVFYAADGPLSYVFSVADEICRYSNKPENDHRMDSVGFETRFDKNSSIASLALRGDFRRYDISRILYSDCNDLRAIFGYDFYMTPSFIFHLKDEWADKTFKNEFEHYLYSSCVKNTWRIAFEKLLSESQSLELGYQYNKETHKKFQVNDVLEKTLFFNWYSKF